jgi:ABC-type nickel/cobalt efflux system permease component RcnA
VDQSIADLGDAGFGVALAVGLLLGLHHATDPDHLTAVSTLIASDPDDGARRARVLGLSWGLGHAATLFAFGLPVVLFGDGLPAAAVHAAELAVGAVIVVLAVRLLIRWRRGYFHAHPHTHGDIRHSHPHVHEGEAVHAHHAVAHDHPHPEALGRSPRVAFGIGLIHGAGGSAVAGALLVGAVGDSAAGAVALAAFALGTALSMALASVLLGGLLGLGLRRGSVARAIPAVGTASLLFGAWYGLAAANLVPYVL